RELAARGRARGLPEMVADDERDIGAERRLPLRLALRVDLAEGADVLADVAGGGLGDEPGVAADLAELGLGAGDAIDESLGAAHPLLELARVVAARLVRLGGEQLLGATADDRQVVPGGVGFDALEVLLGALVEAALRDVLGGLQARSLGLASGDALPVLGGRLRDGRSDTTRPDLRDRLGALRAPDSAGAACLLPRL